jgi:tRNA pseudouridine38-40 synthase
MARFAVGIEYDGRAYSGWQFQPGLQTVQDVVQRALSRVADSPVACVCAGRTDAGVHASAQVVHFETTAVRSDRGWRLGTNSYLPSDVSVAWLREVPGHFHARYSALARSYRYLIFNRDSRSALAAGRATWERRPLDAARMHAAAQVLIGEHDFSAFRAIECQAKSPLRRVERLEVTRDAQWLTIAITANAFLHHMVRNVAGLLMAVGHGESPPERVATVLASRDRKCNAATAPPDGLYLAAVRYPAEFGLPDAASGADTVNAQSAIIGRSLE